MPPPRRLIRRRPLLERIKDYLNPGDFILWASEEIETRDWNAKALTLPLGLGLHVVFVIAISNSKGNEGDYGDDVFDDYSGTGWWKWILQFIVYALTISSIVNAGYAFTKKRSYRFFEAEITNPQNTPSATRVRVDSSPVSASPLRFFTSILGDPSAESRAHPDPTRDVWELALWNPVPLALGLFCTFSPLHILAYWMFLPTASNDPRPSVTVFKTLFLQGVISAQLLWLQGSFSRLIKDTAIITKEVMHEYDTKFVHPLLHPTVRDVGTQYEEARVGEIDTYTPTVLIKRQFKTNPNPNYLKHLDPDHVPTPPQKLHTPTPQYTQSAPYSSRDPTPFSGITPRQPLRQPQFRQSTGPITSVGTNTGGGGDGGNLGIYSHANSPLKKASSMYDMNDSARRQPPKNSYDMARQEVSRDRERERERDRSSSPVKRQGEIGMGMGMGLGTHTFQASGRVPFPEVEGERRMTAPGQGQGQAVRQRPGMGGMRRVRIRECLLGFERG